MPNNEFLDFVVNLVKLGGLGVGALIFVLVFIILFKNDQTTPAGSDLRKKYLIFGSLFAVVALLATTATDVFVASRKPGSVKLGVTIAPDFDEARLPPPKLRILPAGTIVTPDGSVTLTGDSTLTIQIKGLVDSVKYLSESSKKLLETNQTLTTAIEKSSRAAEILTDAPQKTRPEISAAASAIPTLDPADIEKLRASQILLRGQLDKGDFAGVARSSNIMKSVASTSNLSVSQ